VRYLVLAIGIVALSAFFGLAGLHALSAGLFILPVALGWVYGRGRGAFVILAAAGMLGLVVSGSVAVAALYLVIAHIGIVAGILVVRRWPFGWIVAALTAIVFALVCGAMLRDWPTTRKDASIALSARAAQLNKIEEEDSNPQAGAMAETFQAMDRHFEALIFGSTFMTALFLAAFAAHVVTRSVPGVYRRRGGFAQMRPPESLVWLAIGLALLALADLQWPMDGIRLLAWNGGIALAAIYWLNGVAILFYAMDRTQIKPFLRLAILASLAFFAVHTAPMFTALGFFDTWLEIRNRFDRLLELRKLSTPKDEDEGRP